jgi:hypothetical protein
MHRPEKQRSACAGKPQITGASAAANALVERLNPQKGGDGAFNRLNEISVADKHRLLIPVMAAETRITVRGALRGPHGKMEDLPAPIETIKAFALETAQYWRRLSGPPGAATAVPSQKSASK